MKNLVFIAMLSIATIIQSCGQNSDSKIVPENVTTAFKEKFPDVKNAEWEQEDESEWEAEFKMNGKKYSANFSINGDWKETEYEIRASEIPENIISLLGQNFTDYEIEEPEIAETPTGKSYEMEIKKGGDEFEVTIDSKGSLTKKRKSEDKDENEDD